MKNLIRWEGELVAIGIQSSPTLSIELVLSNSLNSELIGQSQRKNNICDGACQLWSNFLLHALFLATLEPLCTCWYE
jgi:hypothetical protein